MKLAASMFDATPSRADLIGTAFPQVRAYIRLAQDAGFEPARACTNPLSKSARGRSVKAKTTPRVGNYQHGNRS